MRLEIEIPQEFESDFKQDKFKDFFNRVIADIHYGMLCGTYERETAEMFIKAFDESKKLPKTTEQEICKNFAENLLKNICIGCGYLKGTECDYKCPCQISQYIVVEQVNKTLKEMGCE